MCAKVSFDAKKKTKNMGLWSAASEYNTWIMGMELFSKRVLEGSCAIQKQYVYTVMEYKYVYLPI